MKKIPPTILLVILIALMPGCAQQGTPTLPAITTPRLVNVICNEFSFYLDPDLGIDYECEKIPESSPTTVPMDVLIFPSHTELTIQDYPLTSTQFPAMIYVYPVNRFSVMLPDVVPSRVSDLENINSGATWTKGALPFLPPVPLEQIFFSHNAVVTFNYGRGVRFITQYNDFDNVISNRSIFYTFQGLTDDGMYWLTVTLPINHSTLPADDYSPWPPEGYTGESWSQNYESYVNQVKDGLDMQLPDSFFPTINILDNLVRSITVNQGD